MIYIGIGSNLDSSFGNRFKNIELAISFLEANKIKILKKSSYYESLSYPDRKKPKFINIIIKQIGKITISRAWSPFTSSIMFRIYIITVKVATIWIILIFW